MINFFQTIREWWVKADAMTRALVLTGILGLAGAVAFSMQTSKQQGFAPLFTRMDPTDASEIVQKIRESKVEYKLVDGGTTIMVPENTVYQLRLDMASNGLPRGGGVGFEVFDKSPLGMTNFTQRVNYMRALQGELSRTVSRMPQVDSARVHLAVPENSLFTRHRRQPSASVYLKLYTGRTISNRQVEGITHLVSTAVEGLSAERVAVLDGAGRLLGPPPGADGNGAATRALSALHEYETRVENRLVSLLEHLVGPGNVVAQVSAEMDLSRSEYTEEKLDPDNSTVRMERKTNETASSRDRDGGVAGTPGNVPPVQGQMAPAGPPPGSDTARKTTQFEYDIPRTVKKVKSPGGEVKRLSVAVLVDLNAAGNPEAGAAPVANENPAPKFTTEALAQLVKKAVGFNTERGDEVEVVFVPFARPDEEAVEMPVVERAGLTWLPGAIGGGLAFLFLGAGLIMSRRKSAEAIRRAKIAEKRAQEEQERALEIQRPVRLREDVRRAAKENPEAVQALVKDWLSESESTGAGV